MKYRPTFPCQFNAPTNVHRIRMTIKYLKRDSIVHEHENKFNDITLFATQRTEIGIHGMKMATKTV